MIFFRGSRGGPSRRPVPALVSGSLSALLALSLAGCAGTPAKSEGRPAASSPAASSPAASGAAASGSAASGSAADSRERLTVGGTERTYLLHRPGGERKARPLLLAFHGRGETASEMRKRDRLEKAAGERGMVVARPEAIDRIWSADTTPTPKRPDPNVDVRFADALIAELVRRGEADPKRVYAVGFSNGGSMAMRFASQRPQRVAAAASVSGQLPVGAAKALDAAAPAPVPVLVVYGEKDAVRPMAGVPNPPAPKPGEEPMTATIGTRDSAAAFARAAGTKPPVTTAHSGYDRTYWGPGKPGGAPVELLVMSGAGHTWPGSKITPPPNFGSTSTALDATAKVLDFLTGR
ncbi:alpha/beta hydrolase family esterase [Streptomyces sp. NPDC004111]|uniref:alpha/beta hydrolase family esterase n=1 Tax=Streptomyces sp. NPDC004111 TaxID=3364690 RepID=UPI0036A4F7C5